MNNKKIDESLTELLETVTVEHIQDDDQLLREISILLNKVNIECEELTKYINGVSR